MANSQYSGVPELTVMVQAAREIVFTAKRQNQLSCVVRIWFTRSALRLGKLSSSGTGL